MWRAWNHKKRNLENFVYGHFIHHCDIHCVRQQYADCQSGEKEAVSQKDLRVCCIPGCGGLLCRRARDDSFHCTRTTRCSTAQRDEDRPRTVHVWLFFHNVIRVTLHVHEHRQICGREQAIHVFPNHEQESSICTYLSMLAHVFFCIFDRCFFSPKKTNAETYSLLRDLLQLSDLSLLFTFHWVWIYLQVWIFIEKWATEKKKCVTKWTKIIPTIARGVGNSRRE